MRVVQKHLHILLNVFRVLRTEEQYRALFVLIEDLILRVAYVFTVSKVVKAKVEYIVFKFTGRD